jgi:predicted  nucleic acid-binding Zn-ribbon protein
MKIKLAILVLVLASAWGVVYQKTSSKDGLTNTSDLMPGKQTEISQPPKVSSDIESKNAEQAHTLASAQALLEASKLRKQRLAEKMKEWEKKIPKQEIQIKVIESRIHENRKILESWNLTEDQIAQVNDIIRQRDKALNELRSQRLQEVDSSVKSNLLSQSKVAVLNAQSQLDSILSKENYFQFELLEKIRPGVIMPAKISLD